jgi:hypothetical protein
MAMPAGSSRQQQQQAAAGSSRQQQAAAAGGRADSLTCAGFSPEYAPHPAVSCNFGGDAQRASGQAGWPSGAGWPCVGGGGRLRPAGCGLKTETPLPAACCLLPVGCGLWLRLRAVGCGLWALRAAGAAGKLGVGSWELEVGSWERVHKAESSLLLKFF